MTAPHVTHSIENTRITISGKHIDLGDALKEHVEQSIMTAVEKYVGRDVNATVTFGHANSGMKFDCHIHLHAGHGGYYEAKAENGSAHNAFDGAMTHISKQLRRHKREKREDKHRGHKEELLQSAI